jgi:hypothetical protein
VASLPSDEEVRARAEELGLLGPGVPVDILDRDQRRALTKELLEERQKPPTQNPLAGELLSRTTTDVAGGKIRVDVIFIPTQKEPDHG